MTSASPSLPRFRQLLLAILLLGFAGTLAELVLLEHYEDLKQWIPLVLLSLGVIVTGLVMYSPGAGALKLFRALMALNVVAGLVGVVLHLLGNYEFERELNPGSSGLEFWLEVFRGATPALAPGTMLQFGLLGLLVVWQHPALTTSHKD